MPLRLLADAGAQTTIPLALSNSATSFVGASTANFPQPQNFANGQSSITLLDSGNPAWNPAAPLATPFEYAVYTTNTVGTNTISGITRGQAGTTAKSFFAGATVAVGLLAEDIVASVPWKFDDQLLGGTAASVVIPSSGSIPASYLGVSWRHIEVTFSTRDTSAGTVADLMLLRINADAGNNYSDDFIRSLAATVAGNQNLSSNFMHVGIVCNGGMTAGIFSAGRLRFPYYALTDRQKNCVGEVQAQTSTATAVYTQGGFWFTTNAAITSLTFAPSNGTFAAGTAFTTYLIP